ncbi:hypothetical protein [Qipengyuania huizhouensis]|uniref:hypothetical protein n=1 Tax=Qipengyuania huizhouensis TaxID=2867245 RepID=UPI001C874BA9|nr:hypothetical protein [Qipengyuania huizhouensis]MBX7460158.1 hypothetical protein [Qipengyuania huizhouensis]
MNIDAKRILPIAGAALALAACTNNDGRLDLTQGDPTWGDANRATMAAQVVDPSPEYDTPIPPTSATNAVRAIDAYNEGNVEEVETISTTRAVSGSGPN